MADSSRILVVDDNAQIRRVLRASLSQSGFIVYSAKSGDQAVERVQDNHPDLVLLDINMPRTTGLEACVMIRKTSDVPIIMLTVRNSEQDKVAALDAGADDFVTKPFSMAELKARIRANLRRMPNAIPSSLLIMSLDDVEINLTTRRVSVGGRPKRLTPKEYELLSYLVANPNVVLTHQRLLQAVWGPEYSDDVQYLHVFVRRLRKKIEPDQGNPRYILTEPWVGYRFNVPARPSMTS